MISDIYSVCAEEFQKISKNRGPSHNLAHVIGVCDVAKSLIEPNENIFMKKLDALCITHDFSDHKYDTDGSLAEKHKALLSRFFSDEETVDLLKTIKYASYSAERKLREQQVRQKGIALPEYETVNWSNPGEYLAFREHVLQERVDWSKYLPEEYVRLRDLLSDADKLEALGSIGLYRCMQYGMEYFTARGVEITPQLLITHVVNHSREKLLILYPHYFCTKKALTRAKELHEEFSAELEKLQTESPSLSELYRRMGM